MAGELPLRYYSGNFALRKPCWRLPEGGAVHALIADGGFRLGEGRMSPVGCWTLGARGIWKRVRLTKKTASFLVRRHGELHVVHGNRWTRLHVSAEVLGSRDCSHMRGRLSLHNFGDFPREGDWVVPHRLVAQSRVSRSVLGAFKR